MNRSNKSIFYSKNSRKFVIFGIAIFIVLAVVFTLIFINNNNFDKKTPADRSAANNEFAIMSTTDMHGKCWDTDLITGKSIPQNYMTCKTAVNKVRNNFKDRTLLFDNGDIFQGNVISRYNFAQKRDHIDSGVNPCALSMADIHYDGYTLGNHEFNYSWDIQKSTYDWLASNGVPCVCANIYNSKTNERIFSPYMLKTIQVEGKDFTIAVIGLENTDIKRWDPEANFPDLIFHSPENANSDLSYEISKVQNEIKNSNIHVDFTIVSMHSGIFTDGKTTDNTPKWEEWRKQAENPIVWGQNSESQALRSVIKSKDVNMFIIGHDHDSSTSNHLEKNSEGRDVLIVNAARFDLTRSIYKVNVAENGDKSVEYVESENLDLKSYDQDKDLREKLEPYAKSTQEYISTPIGKIEDNWDDNKEFSISDLYTKQTDSMDLVARSMLWEGNKKIKEKYQAEANLKQVLKQKNIENINFNFDKSCDAVIMPCGANDLPKKNELTISDAYQLYKYEGTLDCLVISGQEIKNILEYNASYRLGIVGEGENRHTEAIGNKFTNTLVYGLNITYDLSAPNGSRVTIGSFSNGKEFNLNSNYIIAVPAYLRGNTDSPYLGNLENNFCLYEQSFSEGAIQDSIVEYIKFITNKYNMIYKTKNVAKNDEASSQWKITF